MRTLTPSMPQDWDARSRFQGARHRASQPGPSRGSHRLPPLDNLRWSAICFVVILHASVTYSGLGSWYVRDIDHTGRVLRIILGTYQSFQHSVAMGLLFGIAGYFAAGSISRKGSAAFMVVHPPILIATSTWLHGWGIPVQAKFALVSLIGVATSFALMGLVLRQVPGLRRIL